MPNVASHRSSPGGAVKLSHVHICTYAHMHELNLLQEDDSVYSLKGHSLREEGNLLGSCVAPWKMLHHGGKHCAKTRTATSSLQAQDRDVALGITEIGDMISSIPTIRWWQSQRLKMHNRRSLISVQDGCLQYHYWKQELCLLVICLRIITTLKIRNTHRSHTLAHNDATLLHYTTKLSPSRQPSHGAATCNTHTQSCHIPYQQSAHDSRQSAIGPTIRCSRFDPRRSSRKQAPNKPYGGAQGSHDPKQLARCAPCGTYRQGH